MDVLFFIYLLLCSIHTHKSCLPRLLRLENWCAVRVVHMEDKVHPSSNLHPGCRFPLHRGNGVIAHDPHPHIQYLLQEKVMSILHSGLICIETCHCINKLTEKMILPITKISLLSTTALQRYLEYFMGHNSVHLFVFGSYSRSRLLRRSGSSSNRYDWMVDGEGGNDKAEQLLSGSHTDTVRAHIKCAHEVLFSRFHKIHMKHWLIKKSRSPVGFDHPSRKGDLSF